MAVADSLEYIHSRQVIHRDLKPSNIFIPGHPPSIEYRNAKILDFGVAGRLFYGFTRVGMFFGTPLYMSPEQLSGERQSPATDVYGFGLLLFEMLSGKALHKAGTQPFFKSIIDGPPDRAFETIPNDCAMLIRRCLLRDPRERPSTSEIAEELKRLSETKRSAPSSLHELLPVPVVTSPANELPLASD